MRVFGNPLLDLALEERGVHKESCPPQFRTTELLWRGGEGGGGEERYEDDST